MRIPNGLTVESEHNKTTPGSAANAPEGLTDWKGVGMTSVPTSAHPAAELFPMLEGDELRALADDIAVHGLIEPVWLYDDPDRGRVVLDGRNRIAACRLVGVEPAHRLYAGSDPIGFVRSENLRRRHLTPTQVAGVLYREALLREEEEGRRRKAEAARAARLREAEERRQAQDHPQESDDASGSGFVGPGERIPESEPMSTADLPDSPSASDDGPAKPEKPVQDGAPGHHLGDKPKVRAPKSADRAAKDSGTSGRTLARYKRVAEQAPDLVPKMDAGEIDARRAERILRDRQAEQRRIEQARQDAQHADRETVVDIRHGDFREVLADIPDGSVDAVITDPPYPAEYLPLLADLAQLADRVLTPDGVLAVLMGQTHLPEVYRLLSGGRPYRWTAAYLTPGGGYVSMARKVQSNWKPLIVYGGHVQRFGDVVRSEGTDAAAKDHHHWGQDYAAFHTIIERLTRRGQTVLDPFMGSGTTLLAARALGRDAIGCDTDADHVETARRRLQ